MLETQACWLTHGGMPWPERRWIVGNGQDRQTGSDDIDAEAPDSTVVTRLLVMGNDRSRRRGTGLIEGMAAHGSRVKLRVDVATMRSPEFRIDGQTMDRQRHCRKASIAKRVRLSGHSQSARSVDTGLMTTARLMIVTDGMPDS